MISPVSPISVIKHNMTRNNPFSHFLGKLLKEHPQGIYSSRENSIARLM